MKNKILLKLLLPFIVNVFSLNVNSQTISFSGGANYSYVLHKLSDKDISDEFGKEFGFQVGPEMSFEVSKNYSLEIACIAKFLKQSHNEKSTMGDPYSYKSKEQLVYMDFPILIRRNIKLKKINLFIESGPYVSVGLKGNHDFQSYFNGELIYDSSRDINWGNSESNDLKRFEYGLDFGCGAEYKKIVFGLSYLLGLNNVIPHKGVIQKKRCLMLNFGYIFSK